MNELLQFAFFSEQTTGSKRGSSADDAIADRIDEDPAAIEAKLEPQPDPGPLPSPKRARPTHDLIALGDQLLGELPGELQAASKPTLP